MPPIRPRAAAWAVAAAESAAAVVDPSMLGRKAEAAVDLEMAARSPVVYWRPPAFGVAETREVTEAAELVVADVEFIKLA